VLRSEHYFFDLPQYTDFLRDWLASGTVQPEVANKLREWLDGGLKPWDISRDAPYFGFLIPGTEDKYFYVWMDAPIGYMASFRNYADRHNDVAFDEFWDAHAGGRHRSPPLHRQGHHQLPRAVLAVGARRRRLPHADAHPHPRLHHRQRHQACRSRGAPSSTRRPTSTT
jgi:hypothetical protein